MAPSLTPAGTGETRHVFGGRLETVHGEFVAQAAARGFRLLPVVDLDVPSVALLVADLEAFLDLADEMGGKVVYLAPDELGAMLEEHIDVVDELRESLPPGGNDEERDAAGEMARSLTRLQELQNVLGTATFRVGFLREGILHEVLLEDDQAAAGAALAELTLRGELDGIESAVGAARGGGIEGR